MKTLAILGAGELGVQIAHYALTDNHYTRVVFFDDSSNQNDVNSIPIIGKSHDLEKAFKEKRFDELIIGIGYKHLTAKKVLFEKFKTIIPFGKIIHSSAWVDSTTIIEDGCVIYPRCTLDAKTIVKANTILNIGCTIGHDSIISSHCFLSPRVAVAGFVSVNELCNIGINATIIDNICIKSKTQIGAGAVVIKSIDKGSLHVGNPAKEIR